MVWFTWCAARERLELDRKGLPRDLSGPELELRIRFSARKDAEKGCDRGLDMEVVLVDVIGSDIVSLGCAVDKDEMRGGRGEREKELNLLCSCFSSKGGGDRWCGLCIVARRED